MSVRELEIRTRRPRFSSPPEVSNIRNYNFSVIRISFTTNQVYRQHSVGWQNCPSAQTVAHVAMHGKILGATAMMCCG